MIDGNKDRCGARSVGQGKRGCGPLVLRTACVTAGVTFWACIGRPHPSGRGMRDEGLMPLLGAAFFGSPMPAQGVVEHVDNVGDRFGLCGGVARFAWDGGGCLRRARKHQLKMTV